MNALEEQFVKDFMLVTENHFEAYTEAKELAAGGNTSVVAARFQEQFEYYVHQVAEREEEEGREYGALLLRQMLLGFGDTPFRVIADNFIEAAGE